MAHRIKRPGAHRLSPAEWRQLALLLLALLAVAAFGIYVAMTYRD